MNTPLPHQSRQQRHDAGNTLYHYLLNCGYTDEQIEEQVRLPGKVEGQTVGLTYHRKHLSEDPVIGVSYNQGNSQHEKHCIDGIAVALRKSSQSDLAGIIIDSGVYIFLGEDNDSDYATDVEIEEAEKLLQWSKSAAFPLEDILITIGRLPLSAIRKRLKNLGKPVPHDREEIVDVYRNHVLEKVTEQYRDVGKCVTNMCLVLIAHTPIVRDALNYLIDESREVDAIRVGMSHNEFLDTREVMFYDERDLSVEMIEQEYRDKKFYRDKIADAQPVIQQLTNNGILKGIKPVFLEGTRRYDHSGLFYLVDYEPFHPARPNVWGYFTLDDLIKVAWGLPID